MKHGILYFFVFFVQILSAQKDPIIVFGLPESGTDSLIMQKLDDNYSIKTTLYKPPFDLIKMRARKDRRESMYLRAWEMATNNKVKYFVIGKTDTMFFDTTNRRISMYFDGSVSDYLIDNPFILGLFFFVQNDPFHQYTQTEIELMRKQTMSEGKIMLLKSNSRCWQDRILGSAFRYDSLGRLLSGRLLSGEGFAGSMHCMDIFITDSAEYCIVETMDVMLKNDSCDTTSFSTTVYHDNGKLIRESETNYYSRSNVSFKENIYAYDSKWNLIRVAEKSNENKQFDLFHSSILYSKSGKIQSRWDTLYKMKNNLPVIDQYARFDFDDKQQLIKADYGSSYDCYYYLLDGRRDRIEFFHTENDSTVLGYSYTYHYRPDKRLDSLCYTFSSQKSFRLEREGPFDHSVRIVKRKNYPFFKIRYDEQGRVKDYQITRLQQSSYTPQNEFEIRSWPRHSFTYDKKGLPEFTTYRIVYWE